MDAATNLEAEQLVRKVAEREKARSELERQLSRGRGWLLAAPIMGAFLSALLGGLPGVPLVIAVIVGVTFVMALYAAVEAHNNAKAVQALAVLISDRNRG